MIAIVDDGEGAREAVGTLVRSLGHNASTFGSAEEFLKSDTLHDTRCLITDLQMPGLSGLHLQDRLLAEGHRFPIIFMSGHADDKARARAMKAGAISFLSKPTRQDHLVACLEAALKAGNSKAVSGDP